MTVLGLLAIAIALCAVGHVRPFTAAISREATRGNPAPFWLLMGAFVVALAAFLLSFAYGLAKLLQPGTQGLSSRLQGAVLLLPLVSFAAYHVLVKSWLTSRATTLLDIARYMLEAGTGGLR